MRDAKTLDLDELVLMCRDGDSRRMLEEAINCYRVGAFRACIISTWLAVVYDIMGKLRELASSGDSEAVARVAEMDDIIVRHDKEKSMDFENRILDLAKDKFELISHHELVDFQRLREDRHRCAHPSLNRPGEIYRPTAEAARVHLRFSTEHLLSQAPVQGKAAMDRVFSEIDSPLFPTIEAQALAALRLGPMARPKQTLLRNVVNALVSSLLQEDKSFGQKLAALLALRRMYPDQVASFIEKRVAERAPNVPDLGLTRVVRFVRQIENGWEYLPVSVRNKLDTFISTTSVGKIPNTLIASLDIADLRQAAHDRIAAASTEDVAKLIAAGKPRVVIDRAVELFLNSKTFDEANARKRKLLDPLQLVLKPDDVVRIVKGASENSQILHSFEFRDFISNAQGLKELDFGPVKAVMRKDSKLAPFLAEEAEEAEEAEKAEEAEEAEEAAED